MLIIKGKEGWFLLRVVRGNTPNATPLASGGRLADFRVSWLIDA